MVVLKRIVLVALAVLVAIQVFRPSRTNPTADPKNDVAAILPVPPEVSDIFNRSCSDCHSNRTIWPWYSGAAPVSWLVAYDVNRGRRAMNFSEWAARDPKKNAETIQEICKELTEKEMPGLLYPILHPAAKLTDADIQTVCRWTQASQSRMASNSTQPKP